MGESGWVYDTAAKTWRAPGGVGSHQHPDDLARMLSLETSRTADEARLLVLEHPPAAMVYNNANAQVIGGGADTTIIYDTTAYDNASMANLANGRFTVPKAGVYHCSTTVRYLAGGAVGERYLGIFKNSDAFDRPAAQQHQASNGVITLSCSGDVNLAAGDHVISVAFQNSGGNLTLDTSFKTGRFSIHYVGPTT